MRMHEIRMTDETSNNCETGEILDYIIIRRSQGNGRLLGGNWQHIAHGLGRKVLMKLVW